MMVAFLSISAQDKASDENTAAEKDKDHAITPDEPDHVGTAEKKDSEPKYVLPDVPHGWNEFENRYFTLALSFAPILDYEGITQDARNLALVGPQESRFNIRSARVIFHGKLKFRRSVTYYISVEYKGLDRPPEAKGIGVTDLWFAILLNKKIGTLTFGKMKETSVYEMVGDSANLPYLERSLNPFFASRNIGVKLSNSGLKKRMTYAFGWYNDWFTKDSLTFGASGNTFTGRVTALPVFSEAGKNYVHFGISARYNGADAGKLRLRGRPESNVAENFVDTGLFPAKYQSVLGLELLANRGPVFVTSEYVRSWVNSSETGSPQFQGFYVVGSWTITGETRPYDPNVGYARRIIPERRWGAWEIFGRYSYVDLSDGTVRGGTLSRGTVGLNWWASRQWRISYAYGLGELRREGIKGLAQFHQARFQWIF